MSRPRNAWGRFLMVLPLLGWIGLSSNGYAAPLRQELRKPFEATSQTLRGFVIVVDPAGGGEAAGRRHPTHTTARASQYNLMVATHLSHHLKGAGASVYLTRMDDRATTLGAEDRSEREAIVRGAAPHIVLTLAHADDPKAPKNSVRAFIAADNKIASDPLTARAATLLVKELASAVPGANTRSVIAMPSLPEVPRSLAPTVMLEPGNFSDAAFASWAAKAPLESVSRAIYEALARLWQQDAEALAFRREQAFGVQTVETPAKSPTARPPESASTNVEKLARSLWPIDRAPATPAELRFVLDHYRRRALSDWTLFLLETTIEETSQGLNLTVRTNAQEIGDTAVGIARALGTPLSDARVELLPSPRLGERRFGVTCVPMAFVWGQPRELDDVQTQLLLGDCVWLLDETPDGSYLLVHGTDSYLGWVRSDAIQRLDASRFDEWLNAPAATFVREHEVRGVRFSPAVRLPLASPAAADAKVVRLRLPAPIPALGEKSTIEVPRDAVRLSSEIRVGQKAIEIAQTLLGRPYVFGGRSSLGTDCSGLVSDAYAALGHTLPRDARQQVLVGKLVATRWHRTALRPGDTLFFIDTTGRVIHTGLSLGGSRFIHQCPPEVQVSSFDPADPLYSKTWDRAFIFGRRPLD